MPLISVIVPVYNVETYLKRCVESIINQTFGDFELILVDDESTDNSGKICDEFSLGDKRVKVIHKKNGGVSSARNYGLAEASGEYVTFCDSDDYLEPDCLEILLNNIVEKCADCLSYSYKLVNDKEVIKTVSHIIGFWEFDSINDSIDFIKNNVLMFKTGFEVCTRLFKLSIINDYNIRFCEDCENFAEDMAFTIEYLTVCKSTCSIDYFGYCYYSRENSMTNTSKSSVKLNALNEVSKHYYNFLQKNISDKKILSQYPYIHFLIMNDQFQRIFAFSCYKDVPELVGKIADWSFYKKMISKAPRFKDELVKTFGKQMAFDNCNLCKYTIHKNYKLFCLKSAVYYKFIYKK